jgi:hypothetical protein
MEKFFFDHNGQLLKKDAYPFRIEDLPGLIKKPFKVTVVEGDQEKKHLGKTMWRGKSERGRGRYRLPEFFKDYVIEKMEPSVGFSEMRLSENVRLGKNFELGTSKDKRLPSPSSTTHLHPLPQISTSHLLPILHTDSSLPFPPSQNWTSRNYKPKEPSLKALSRDPSPKIQTHRTQRKTGRKSGHSVISSGSDLSVLFGSDEGRSFRIEKV